MKQAAHAGINNEIANLDELLALLGAAEPGTNEQIPRYPLLEEHARAARSHLLAAARWEYEDSLKQALREAKKIQNHNVHTAAINLLNGVIESHQNRHRDD